MVDELLRRGEPLDEVIFCDTGHEFPIMYEYIQKIKKYWEDKYPNIKVVLLNWGKGKEIWENQSENPFTRGQFKGIKRGFPFAVGMSWCTRELKIKPMQQYLKKKFLDKGIKVHHYIGIAANEEHRATGEEELYPLIEWGVDEDTIAQELVKRGLHNPLYNHFSRTGCFNCPKQSLKSLYRLWKHYPEQWKYIEDTQRKYEKEGYAIWKFKNYTADELITKFKKYEKLGKPTHYLEEEEPIGCFCK